MAKHVHIHIHRATRDAGWEENKHPRKDDGKFGSGGSGAASSTASAPAPFVADLHKRFTSPSKMAEYVGGLDKEKLQKAADLLKGRTNEQDVRVRKLIEKELDGRANRGV